MGSNIEQTKNEIDKKFNSFLDQYSSDDRYSISQLESKIDEEFTKEELKNILAEDNLKKYYITHKKKTLNDIEKDKENRNKIKSLALINEQHNKTIKTLENNAREQEQRFNEQQESLKAKLKEENNQTKVFFEKKMLEQEKQQKEREQEYKKENEKKIALLNEQHNKTIKTLENNAREQ